MPGVSGGQISTRDLAFKVLSLRLRAPNYEEFSTLNPRGFGFKANWGYKVLGFRVLSRYDRGLGMPSKLDLNRSKNYTN